MKKATLLEFNAWKTQITRMDGMCSTVVVLAVVSHSQTTFQDISDLHWSCRTTQLAGFREFRTDYLSCHFVAVTVCEGDQSRTLPRKFNLSDSSAKVHYVDFDPTLLHHQRLGILQRRKL